MKGLTKFQNVFIERRLYTERRTRKIGLIIAELDTNMRKTVSIRCPLLFKIFSHKEFDLN